MKRKLKKFNELNLFAEVREITMLEKELFDLNNILPTMQAKTETSSN